LERPFRKPCAAIVRRRGAWRTVVWRARVSGAAPDRVTECLAPRQTGSRSVWRRARQGHGGSGAAPRRSAGPPFDLLLLLLRATACRSSAPRRRRREAAICVRLCRAARPRSSPFVRSNRMDVTESIGATALMAAALRAAEAEQPRPIFEDRFAPLFAVEKIA